MSVHTSQAGFLSAAMSNLHLLAPLAHLSTADITPSTASAPRAPPPSSASPPSSFPPVIEDRSLLLRALGWLLDLNPTAALSTPSTPDSPPLFSVSTIPLVLPAMGGERDTAYMSGAEFAVEAYVCCLRMAGREALRLRTQAMQLLPDFLLGLTAPTPSTTLSASKARLNQVWGGD